MTTFSYNNFPAHTRRLIDILALGQHSALLTTLPGDRVAQELAQTVIELSDAIRGYPIPCFEVNSALTLMRNADRAMVRRVLTTDNFMTTRIQRAFADRYLGGQILAIRQSCPCGYLGDTYTPCFCTVESVVAHQLHADYKALFVAQIDTRSLKYENLPHETYEVIAERLSAAYQRKVYGDFLVTSREGAELHALCVKRSGLGTRQSGQLVHLARTIAHLNDSAVIGVVEMAEAAHYFGC